MGRKTVPFRNGQNTDGYQKRAPVTAIMTLTLLPCEVFTLKKANNKITARTLDSASNPENKCLLSNVSMPIVQNDNYKNGE